MSETTALIIAALGLLGSILGFAGIVIGLRTKAAVTHLAVEVNSRLSSLLELTGTAEHAKGVIEGHATGVADEVARAGSVGTPDG